MTNLEKHKCCICKKEFIGRGHNPSPIRDEGRCCDDCNIEIVIPERLRRMKDES